MKKQLLLVFSIFSLSQTIRSQCLDAGTGTDGAWSASGVTTIAGGTYNFTSFTIDTGAIVTVTGTQPLIIKCTGPVKVNGVLSASGASGADGVTYTSGGVGAMGVAGGGNGGDGTFASSFGPIPANPGTGPGATNNGGAGWSGGGGAGYVVPGDSSHGIGGIGGPVYGDVMISSLEAGSGGGGGAGGYDCGAGGGGAGGGLIMIAAGDSLIIGAAGAITVNGGNGGSDGTGNCGGGGGGSGGSLWIVASSVTNNGQLNADGGLGGASAVSGNPYYGTGGNGSPGRIRIDHDGVILGSGTISPAFGYTTGISTLTFSSAHTDISCYGANDGTASVNANSSASAITYSWAPAGGSGANASMLAPGSYTCTITDMCGSKSAVVTITEPALISSLQTLSFCSGQSVAVGTHTYTTTGMFSDTLTAAMGCDSIVTTDLTILSASGSTDTQTSCGPFLWIDGNTYSTSTTTPTYTLTNATGCDSVITLDLTISVPDTGIAVMIPTCTCPSFIQVNVPASSYQWYDCTTSSSIPGATNQFFYPSMSGTYAAIITLNGCTDTSACVAFTYTGLHSLSSASSALTVYPNPNEGTFTIKASREGTYTLVNELGVSVRTYKTTALSNYSVTIGELGSGVYYVINADNTARQKIVVTK